MSTATIKAALRGIYETGTADEVARAQKAMRELEAIEKAARDATRLHMGDMTYNIRETEAVMKWADATGKSTWEAPDVKDWSDAAQVLKTIAREAK